ncbi:MAG: dihydroxyacetone kinase subunit DhaK [Candidatus Methylomirabilales bacterium]
MKKIINDPFAFVDEMLEGILLAHPDRLRLVGPDRRAVVRADAPVPGKVGIATGGGSGHLPVFMGYVGPGFVDGCAIGNVFSSPTVEQMLAATQAIHGGAGVLYLFGNYQGDVLNFGMAAEMAAAEGIPVETVLAADDVASAPTGQEARRRGVAGIFYAYKLAGAKAETKAPLAEVKRIAEKAVAHTRSMGVALSPCTVPAAGRPTFTIGEDEMEIGMGIHGEPGMYRKVHQMLSARGVAIHRPYLGEYATSMEMAGASVSLCRLDGELQALLDAPAATPFVRLV